jgi:hypothetical protein
MSFLFGESGVWNGDNAITSTNTTAAVPTKNASTAVFECTADSTFTCTVEACLDQTGTNWRQVPCILSNGGTYERYAAGATITLTSGDIVFVPSVGYMQVRVKRAGGTATIRAHSHPAIAEPLMTASGVMSSKPFAIGETVESIAVSNSVLKVFAPSSWASNTATTNAAFSREIDITNCEPLGGLQVYLGVVASGADRSGTVSSTDFMYSVDPLATMTIKVPAGYELTVVRGSAATTKVTATERLYV